MQRTSPAVVTWGTLIATVLVLLALMTGLAAAAGWWAWRHMAAQIVLRDQVADIVLPSGLAVRAALSNHVDVRIDQVVEVKVPIRETLSIPVTQPIEVSAQVDAVVPVHLDVPVNHVIHIDQAIELDTEVQTRVLGFGVTVPIKGRVPLKADVPVNLVIPVRQELPVSLRVPATVRLPEPIRAQVDTVIRTRVPIHESMSLPVTAPFNADIRFPQQHTTVGLQAMQIDVPFDAISLGRRATPAKSTAPALPPSPQSKGP